MISKDYKNDIFTLNFLYIKLNKIDWIVIFIIKIQLKNKLTSIKKVLIILMYKKATFFVHILHKKGFFIVWLKKPLITSLLIGGLISSVSVPVFAENNTSTINNVTNSQTEGSIDVNSSD